MHGENGKYKLIIDEPPKWEYWHFTAWIYTNKYGIKAYQGCNVYNSFLEKLEPYMGTCEKSFTHLFCPNNFFESVPSETLSELLAQCRELEKNVCERLDKATYDYVFELIDEINTEFFKRDKAEEEKRTAKSKAMIDCEKFNNAMDKLSEMFNENPTQELIDKYESIIFECTGECRYCRVSF